MKYSLLAAIFLTIFGAYSFSQDDDLILGDIKNDRAALYDLSDPMGVNMEVNLWGFVRYPGRYRVPVTTTFLDLISYSGGPTEESNLEEVRIIRMGSTNEKKTEVIKLNYDDLLWGESVSSKVKINPVLHPNDVILVMQENRYSFREDISFFLPILTTIVTITTLLLTIANQ